MTERAKMIEDIICSEVGLEAVAPYLADRIDSAVANFDRVAADAWQPGEGLPPANQKVLAWLEGWEEHSGGMFTRTGFAFMVRHPGDKMSVKDGWAGHFYDKALKEIQADGAEVKRWWPLPASEGDG